MREEEGERGTGEGGGLADVGKTGVEAVLLGREGRDGEEEGGGERL